MSASEVAVLLGRRENVKNFFHSFSLLMGEQAKIHFLVLFKSLPPPGLIKPARSVGFGRIKKIPYQAPPTQLGPQECTLWKNAF